MLRIKIEWERDIAMGLTFNRAVMECSTGKVVFEQKPEGDEAPGNMDSGETTSSKGRAA